MPERRRLLAMDRALLVLMRTRGHSDPRLERAALRCSRAGEHAACWLVLGVAGLALSRSPSRRRAWGSGVAATGFAYGLNYAVKLEVRRPRPTLPGLPPLSPVVSRLSFPSAHATTSFAAAGAYTRALPAAAPLLYGGAIALALTRPYLGVHYPSDVLAGATLGALVARAWPR